MDAVNILDLPVDVLEVIFSHLRWRDVVRLEVACTQFKQLAHRSVTTIRGIFNVKDEAKVTRCIHKYSQGLQELEILNCMLRPDDVLHLCEQATRLTKLEICAPYDRREDGSMGLFKLTEVRELMLKSYGNLQTLGEVLSLTKLTRLAIPAVPTVFSKQMTRLSNIVEMELFPYGLIFINKEWNFLSDLTAVKSLILHDKVVSQHGISDAVPKMTQLQSLVLYPVSHNQTSLMLSNFTILTHLRSTIDKNNISYLSRFQQLKTIILEHPFSVTSDEIVDQLVYLPNLERATFLEFNVSCQYDKLISCSKLTRLVLRYSSSPSIGKEPLAAAQAEAFKRIAQLTMLKKLEKDTFTIVRYH